MYTNLNITGINIYHPRKKVNNQYYLNILKQNGLNQDELDNAKKFMEALGRDKRYIVDNNSDNTLTMAFEAAKKALQEANISPEDIDIIKFATDTPEYTYPSNALLLTHMLGAENVRKADDVNSNCIGMLTALDETVTYMKYRDNYEKALVVGSVHASSIMRKNDPMTFPIFSDGACALVVEKQKQNEKRGFIDSTYYTNTIQHNIFKYPNIGFSKVLNETACTEEEKKLRFSPEPVSFFSDDWKRLSEEVLEKK